MNTFEIFSNEFVKELWSIFGIGLFACSVLLIKLFRELLINLGQKICKKFINKLTFKETIGLIRYIDDGLVELRTKLNADRAYIHEFKNGDHFSAKNPIWRIFRSYEKCNTGIIYEGSTLKGEQVTSIFDIIEPAITGISKSNGITIMDCSKCNLPCKEHNVVVYNINNMPHTASKQMLLNHNVKISIQINLMINDNIVGILAIDFCDELSQTMLNDSEWLHNCCKVINQYADRMEYCLANPEKFKS